MQSITAVLLLACLGVCVQQCTAGLPAAEIDALKALHSATNGEQWRANKWPSSLTGDPCKQWKGVRCKGGHVTQLSFEHTFSGGHLPGAIAALDYLEILDIGSSRLSGSLPTEIGSMHRLEQIEADGNHFEGAIPAAWESLRSNKCPGCAPRNGASTGGARVFIGEL